MSRPLPLLLVVALAACSAERDLSTTEQALVTSSRGFGWRLIDAVAKEQPEENVVVSPLSVSLALGMTMNGAGGETRAAMARVLDVEHLSAADANAAWGTLVDYLLGLDSDVEFALANAIWHRSSFEPKPAFLELNREFFDAQVAGLDFASQAAVDTMNGWVSDQTHGRIPSIVEGPIDATTMMFLINALYFKGDWAHGFEESATKPMNFQLADASRVLVPTMNGELRGTRMGSAEGLRALELPFGEGRYSMVFVVPDSGANLDAAAWQRALASLADVEKVNVALPRFKVEFGAELRPALSALGMGVAFESSADLSGINDLKPLYIQKVTHKTFVEVTESGAEPAAATSVAVGTRSANLPESFAVDRPFLFAIRERANDSLLFLGRVLDPR